MIRICSSINGIHKNNILTRKRIRNFKTSVLMITTFLYWVFLLNLNKKIKEHHDVSRISSI